MTKVTPKQVFERLCKIQGIALLNGVPIKQRKDKKLNNKIIIGHISAIFVIAKLKEIEKEILASMSAFSITRFNKTSIITWLKLDDTTPFEKLITMGWVQLDGDKVSLHQIIVDLIYKEETPTTDNCKNIVTYMSKVPETMRGMNSYKRKQVVQLCKIFGSRIKGSSVDLFNFYVACVFRCGEQFSDQCLAKAGKIILDVDSQIQFWIIKTTFSLRYKETFSLKNYKKAVALAKQHYNDYSLATVCFDIVNRLLNADSELYYIEDKDARYCKQLIGELFAKIVDLVDPILYQKFYTKVCDSAVEFYGGYLYLWIGDSDSEQEWHYSNLRTQANDRRFTLGCMDWIDGAKVYEQKGDFESAIKYYEMAIEEEMYHAYPGLIKLYIQLGDTAKVDEIINQYINCYDDTDKIKPMHEVAMLDKKNTVEWLLKCETLMDETSKYSVLVRMKLYELTGDMAYFEQAYMAYQKISLDELVFFEIEDFMPFFEEVVNKIGDTSAVVDAYKWLGNIADNGLNPELASKNFYEGYKLADEHFGEYDIRTVELLAKYLESNYEIDKSLHEKCHFELLAVEDTFEQWQHVSKLYECLQDYKQAIKYGKIAINFSTDDNEKRYTFEQLAMFYEYLGDIENYVIMIKEAMTISGDVWQGYLDIGQAYMRQEDYENAEYYLLGEKNMIDKNTILDLCYENKDDNEQIIIDILVKLEEIYQIYGDVDKFDTVKLCINCINKSEFEI
ncbi:MAG: hypothetical protein ATN35_09690 [Epulopiscium sp. Nele67-Bin004]|nr:MAG: hypothetical protein ATN35_09690 [Epulopiscium sp. Nele67-Bin004]